MKTPLPLHLRIALVCGVIVLLIGCGIWLWLGSAPGSMQTLALKAAGGDPEALSGLKALGPDAVPGLVKVLEYQDPYWRREAWRLWPKLPRRLARALLRKAGPLVSPDVRAAGARCLGALGPQAQAAVPNLLTAMHDHERFVALAAAAALAQIGKPSIPGLTSALNDTNPIARQAAAYGLGEIGALAEPAVADLIGALQDPDPMARSSTGYSLGVIGFPSLLALSNVIDHGDSGARAAAVKEFILLYRGLRIMSPVLNKMAQAPDAASRRLALETLGTIRATDETTLNTMVASLKDPAQEVRLAALRALSLVAWRAERGLEALKDCLRDPSPAVRAWAAKVLGAMGPAARPALDDLSGALNDSQPDVRAAAREAMDRIQTKLP